MKDRDIIILKKIINYSERIRTTINRFELDFEKFSIDFVVKDAIGMSVLQIGELAVKLSDEFKSKYNKMPWREIISMRNRAAHDYEEMNIETLWEIAVTDIPELKIYCENILEEIEEHKQLE